MIPAKFDYVRPSSVGDAVSALASGGGQLDQCVDRRAGDRPLLDVLGTDGPCPIARVPKDLVYGGVPVHPVTLASEGVGGAGIADMVG